MLMPCLRHCLARASQPCNGRGRARVVLRPDKEKGPPSNWRRAKRLFPHLTEARHRERRAPERLSPAIRFAKRKRDAGPAIGIPTARLPERTFAGEGVCDPRARLRALGFPISADRVCCDKFGSRIVRNETRARNEAKFVSGNTRSVRNQRGIRRCSPQLCNVHVLPNGSK